SFTNFFIFFPPVYTYDEPLQFCFMFLSLILFFKKRIFCFVLAFTLAIIIRETSMIILPGLFFYFIYDNKISFKQNLVVPDFRIKVIAITIPLFIYGIYSYYIMRESTNLLTSRDYFLLRFSRMGYNFQN